MTKKNLKPQQTAPVQREINISGVESGQGLTPAHSYVPDGVIPFAGDDAE